ncbi:collagen alpha-2(I) chain isoform X1 [Helicoverpa armigera]|uniref:collagen alpha-2(I) chain isoform X1 n=1 Tax=Helicoverpa armigera TaxID=29058 RepID=UPI003083B985
MNIGVLWLSVLLVASSSAKWRWPEGEAAASVRIDTKVRFIESGDDRDPEKMQGMHRVQSDAPFKEPQETEGFYNRPPGSGRYPVRVEAHRTPYRVDDNAIYPVHTNNAVSSPPKTTVSDGTLDSLQYCKCVSNPDCDPRPDSLGACGAGKFLCCYPRPSNKDRVTPQNTEFFNELEDQRPMLLPGRENLARPFPPPPNSVHSGLFGSYGPGHDHDSSHIGVFDKPLVLIGPSGPSGPVGPPNKPIESGVLVGPEGPTGIVGPLPNGPPDSTRSESAQRGVLVGPVGPSGIVGSYGRRPVLVGPGGPTGIIGPSRTGRGPNVLVGPGGPTGIIGPARQPGLLTGPGGPTGSIGPGRPILVGPGGPTGQIGPRYYGCAHSRRRTGSPAWAPRDFSSPAPIHKHRRNAQPVANMCDCKQ